MNGVFMDVCGRYYLPWRSVSSARAIRHSVRQRRVSAPTPPQRFLPWRGVRAASSQIPMKGGFTTNAADTLQHIVWQPIVNLKTSQILGYEALARFSDRSPLEAFASAGDPKAQIALDHRCTREALTRPPDAGLIFLNVTPATVQAGQWPCLPDRLRHRVVWELPEAGGWQPAMIPGDYTVALDDVGSGFAELVRVAQVPWRFLKIDASLVADVGTYETHRALIRDLVARARERQGAVIAEGIEATQDAAALAGLGVTYGQGYLWGYPQRDPSSLLPRAAPGYNEANMIAKGR